MQTILVLAVFIGLPLLAAFIRAIGEIVVVQAGARRALQAQGLDGQALRDGTPGVSGYGTVER